MPNKNSETDCLIASEKEEFSFLVQARRKPQSAQRGPLAQFFPQPLLTYCHQSSALNTAGPVATSRFQLPETLRLSLKMVGC